MQKSTYPCQRSTGITKIAKSPIGVVRINMKSSRKLAEANIPKSSKVLIVVLATKLSSKY